YFRVRLAAPSDLSLPGLAASGLPATEGARRRLTQLPRLRPLDGEGAVFFDGPRMLPPQKGRPLCFLGRWPGDPRPRHFQLSYPTRRAKKEGLPGLVADAAVKTVAVRLDWAKETARPSGGAGTTDLERHWAEAELWHLGVLEARTAGVGLFTLARQQR